MMGSLRRCKPTVRFSWVSKNLLRFSGFQSAGVGTVNQLTACNSSVVSKSLLGFNSSSVWLGGSFGSENLLGLGFSENLGYPFGHFVGIRQYCVDRNPVVKFKTAPSVKYLGHLTRFCGRLESVPYTKQTLFVIPLFDKIYRVLGSDGFEEEGFPDTHPHCIRVRMIAKKLLNVLEREDGKLHILAGEEWPEDLWVRDWEVLVRNHPDVHAWYTRTGRLLIASALCDYYKTDAEVAFSIAHLMGHVVARHSLREMIFNFIPFTLFYLVKHGRFPSSYYQLRHEQEADYIGIFLAASAGYDPQVAPAVLRNKTEGAPSPFMAKRIESISHPKVMQEAVALYQKSIKEQGNN
ncbi:hypothetical protein ACET3Z_029050 [Daucus carota]